MQKRLVDPGDTIIAEHILSMNYAFFHPAVIKGGELSISSGILKINPGFVLLPNGVLLEEAEFRQMSFKADGWKTVFYRYVENQVLGGLPIELDCIDGVYSQEELVLTSDINLHATVIAWAHKDMNGFDISRPNNDKYPQYKMTIDDFPYNKTTAKELLIQPINEPSSLIKVTEMDGTQVIDMETIKKYFTYNPITGCLSIGDPEILEDRIITIRIPFTTDHLGSFVIERLGYAGSEMRFSLESLEGQPVSPALLNLYGLTGKFSCKGNYIINLDGTRTQYSTYNASNSTLTTNLLETKFYRIIVRPERKHILAPTSEISHPDLPTMGVFRIDIYPPDINTGSESIQLLRSVGISKYNVPQILR